MTVEFAKILWLIGGVGWYVIRFPYERRNKRKNKVVKSQFDLRETLLLACSLSGLGIVPLIYVFSGFPAFADYSFHWLQAGAGAVAMVAALAMFRLSHRDLGRNWSVSLELHDSHSLVTEGSYRYVRHPMYTAFWLLALAQVLLLPNWIAGPAGLVGFGILFFGRVAREEAMMLSIFGDQYREYMKRTARIFPGLY
ncbi:protein-S-isoprenylcysteine O-methyltransferase [Blastochloris sulfoviridis]|uniref:Isoprenylcysteine carboxylmethyltransferase family protein n=1 Tax=Blastochloris sulfoviridis TaxID=50712 RepID=A0A5M6I2A2_9HYPH|nr:protein-S-isoprenylcysteine O-methyltransferase [Blastochloris sulfoviridis]KAA5602340.1 isoprenylcysteine carboxylmethyltransferase family protein [Blastochloris sulfoviridis]